MESLPTFRAMCSHEGHPAQCRFVITPTEFIVVEAQGTASRQDVHELSTKATFIRYAWHLSSDLSRSRTRIVHPQLQITQHVVYRRSVGKIFVVEGS